MATSNQPDDIDLEKLKVQEDKPKKEKVKQEKVKKEKKNPAAEAAPVAEATPVEELNFNRPAEEVGKAVQQWNSVAPLFNKPNPNEKMFVYTIETNLRNDFFFDSVRLEHRSQAFEIF